MLLGMFILGMYKYHYLCMKQPCIIVHYSNNNNYIIIK